MFFLPTKINLGTIDISEFGLGSSFTLGQTQIINQQNRNKKNQGFGQQIADCSNISLPIHFVMDADVIDSITIKTES